MDITNKSVDELVSIALKTMNLNEMLFLQRNPSMNVRRALARNRNTPSSILNDLEYDPVENVSYMASKHPNAKANRSFENLRPCVLCEDDIRSVDCVSCIHTKEHSF